MPKLIIILLLQCAIAAYAQSGQPHVSEPPPPNPGYPFLRGMYVDCAGDIINDMASGNPLQLQQQLLDYIDHNFIGYIILCDLENAGVFGNTLLESTLKYLLFDLKSRLPGMKVGLLGNTSAFFSSTSFLKGEPDRECLTSGSIQEAEAIKRLFRAETDEENSIYKFFRDAARFNTVSRKSSHYGRCDATFDALVLESRYWDQTASLSQMQSAFEVFKSALIFLQYLKCKYACIQSVDAEFLPNDLFRLQGWTAIDQITEADPLIDRVILPGYTDQSNGIFDMLCKTMHFLSDRFSRPGTALYVGLSAESPSYQYCNAITTPRSHLGDYLDGTTWPSGNMHSVEKNFLASFNDPAYMCMSCSCFPYADNHYGPTNKFANKLNGMLWRPYSMMQTNMLYRKKPASIDDSSKRIISIDLFDVEGRLIKSIRKLEGASALTRKLSAGLYIQCTRYSDGTTKCEKKVIPDD